MAAYIQDVFMCFGDSITQGAWEPGLNGFGQRLSHVYARKLDVLNRGYSGYTTEWATPVFNQCIALRTDTHVPKIRVLTIWFGANDACVAPSPQHVPLPRFISNLKYFIEQLKSPTSPRYSPTTRIILISPPPVNTLQRRADLESRVPPVKLDREFEVTKTYADTVRDVAKEMDVAFADVFQRLWQASGMVEANLSRYLIDGLHLNEAGYAIMYEELITTIKLNYPEVHYDYVQFTHPPWKELNWANPGESFRR